MNWPIAWFCPQSSRKSLKVSYFYASDSELIRAMLISVVKNDEKDERDTK